MRWLLILLLAAAPAWAQEGGSAFPPDATGGGTAYDGGSVTNPFLAPSGCVAPGYAFTGATTTGLCWESGTTLDVSAFQTHFWGNETTRDGLRIVPSATNVIIETIGTSTPKDLQLLGQGTGSKIQLSGQVYSSSSSTYPDYTFSNFLTSGWALTTATGGSTLANDYSFFLDAEERMSWWRTAATRYLDFLNPANATSQYGVRFGGSSTSQTIYMAEPGGTGFASTALTVSTSGSTISQGHSTFNRYTFLNTGTAANALRYETNGLGTTYTDVVAATPTAANTVTVPDDIGTVVLTQIDTDLSLTTSAATATAMHLTTTGAAGTSHMLADINGTITLDCFGNDCVVIKANGGTRFTFNSAVGLYPGANDSYDLGNGLSGLHWRYAGITRGMEQGKTTTLTDAVNTNIFTLTMGSSGISYDIKWHVYATDTTDHQVLKGKTAVTCYNNGGTVACATTDIHADLTSLTAGTLTCTETIATGANSAQFQLNCDTSLTPTTFNVQSFWEAHGNVVGATYP